MLSFSPGHFLVLLEYEREWVVAFVSIMAWRAKLHDRNTWIMANETVMKALEVRARLLRN
jgi:hypothetical protein